MGLRIMQATTPMRYRAWLIENLFERIKVWSLKRETTETPEFIYETIALHNQVSFIADRYNTNYTDGELPSADVFDIDQFTNQQLKDVLVLLRDIDIDIPELPVSYSPVMIFTTFNSFNIAGKHIVDHMRILEFAKERDFNVIAELKQLDAVIPLYFESLLKVIYRFTGKANSADYVNLFSFLLADMTAAIYQ